MRRFLAVTIFMTLCGTAYAAPPQVGEANYSFEDPVFGTVVLCDTPDEIRSIATSNKPNETFQGLFSTPNALNQPTCAAGQLTAHAITSVEPIGIMTFDSGDHFNAWVIGVDLGTVQGAVLYLEPVKLVGV